MLAYIGLMCVSCVHDEMEYGVDFSQLPTHGLAFVPYAETDYDLSSSPIDSMAVRRKASCIDGVGLLRGLTESLTASTVHQVSGTYRSVDAYGKPVTLSGAVYYPEGRPLKGIIVSGHYTVCADFEVPSQSCHTDAWLATKGYLLVMPDYMGYGSTADSIPPYMQADLTARHMIDMALAVRSFVASRGLIVQSPDIILAGYSQGANAAIHAMRLLEDPTGYPEYADAKMGIRKCYLGGGPYFISAFYQHCVEKNYIAIPSSVPLLILGMNVGRKGYDRLDPKFFFSERTYANYEDWILSKRYTLDQLNDMIGTSRLDSILSKNACDLNYPRTRKFYLSLFAHDVPPSFVPKAPLYVFHSKGDDIVAFYNAERLQSQLEKAHATNVTYDFDDYGIHGMGYARFLLKLYNDLP